VNGYISVLLDTSDRIARAKQVTAETGGVDVSSDVESTSD